MPAKFKNNASATIAASISNTDTTIVLTTGFGSYFPTLTSGFYFYGTLFNAAGESEVVKVTARSSDTLTVVRGQDGTTAKAFIAGDGFALRVVSANLDNFVQLDGTQTITGAKTFTAPITAPAGLVGDVTGNAGTVTNGVYVSGDQSITGSKTFSDIAFSDAAFKAYVAGPSALVLFDNSAGNADYIYYDRVGNTFGFAVNSISKATLDANGNFTASGDVTAYSDARLKTDVQTISNALAITKQLRGTSFTKDGKASLGVIAQEVQAVLPQVVQENSDGYLSVAYGNMVGVLIEAVKELSEKVDALENTR